MPLAEHPIAARAARLAAEAGEPSTLRILEEMLGVMHELEARFPGVPFADILSDKAQTSGDDRARIRRTLTKAGACAADIDLVCPKSQDPALLRRRYLLTTDPYAMPKSGLCDRTVADPDRGRL